MGEVIDKIELASNKELDYNKNRLNEKILKSNKIRRLCSGAKALSCATFVAGVALSFVSNPIVGVGLQVLGGVGYFKISDIKRKADEKLFYLNKVKYAIEEEIEIRLENQ